MLARSPTGGFVPFCCTRRSYLSMSGRTDMHLYSQFIPCDHAARRVYDNSLAYLITFRIERFLHQQGAMMISLHHAGDAGTLRKLQPQMGPQWRIWSQIHFRIQWPSRRRERAQSSNTAG